MKTTPSRYLTPALAAMLALGLSVPPAAEAKKKDDDRSKKKSRSSVQHRENRGTPRNAQVARRSAPSRSHSSKSRAVASSRHRPSPSRTIQRKPVKKHIASRSSSRSRVPQQRLASASVHRHDNDRNRDHRVTKSSPVRRSSSISQRERDARSRAIARSADRHHDIRRAPVRRDSDRKHVVRSDRDHDRNRYVSSHREPRHSHNVRQRDRGHYHSRHEHHSHDWYRNNGWDYDYDYYRVHRQHRYYNDLMATFIFDTSGPAYNSGYSYPARPAYDGYGYDLETLYAVQVELANAGYYYGEIDGQIGPGSRSAIINYQQDYNLPVTGRVDSYLLESLGIQ
ncbi:peptidoglycan-binding domain-containing protein [Verrucomicrobium spinosum]|uniref:peptidoglycan-binding domain-containing protein n=1 Tax=Verrucomicrobium spinosum TaxID=2736 RepID=UPI0018DBF633|nr:peptidoglycan-binding domain-containing protein [Verrucomicrobium spinosum]